MNDQHHAGLRISRFDQVGEGRSRLSAEAIPDHCVTDGSGDHHTQGGTDALGRFKRHGAEGSEPTNRPMTPERSELRSSTDRVDHALRRCRPLRRRLRMTFRPARSDIRARKPCFMALRRLFGWKVRFTSVSCRAVAGSASAGPMACRPDPGRTRINSRPDHGRGERVTLANAGGRSGPHQRATPSRHRGCEPLRNTLWKTLRKAR